MKLRNTLSGEIEKVKPTGTKVGIYTCGMTVQDKPHIGHMKTFITADVLRRYLIFKGHQVTQIINFTDIEDKIIAKAHKLNKDWRTLAEENINSYFSVSDQLNIMRADHYPRATQFISEMITLVEKLIQKGYGYVVEGDVYFSVEKFPNYGKLSKKKLEELMPGARVAVEEKKRHPLDFALWKKSKEREPWWNSPWGKGRPGWHIECSAMSMSLLGNTIDIHTGAEDLIFPHHENEIAQSEGATGETFVKYWVHNTWLNLSGEKMSKSTDHFLTASEVLGKYTPQAIRIFFLKSHYRMPQEYDEDRIKDAEASYQRIQTFLSKGEPVEGDIIRKSDFITAMDDDLNTPKALGIIFDLVNEGYDKIQHNEDVGQLVNSAKTLLEVLGFNISVDLSIREKNLINTLITVRELMRKNKNFDIADEIRSKMNEIGLIIEDTKDKTIWRAIR